MVVGEGVVEEVVGASVVLVTVDVFDNKGLLVVVGLDATLLGVVT